MQAKKRFLTVAELEHLEQQLLRAGCSPDLARSVTNAASKEMVFESIEDRDEQDRYDAQADKIGSLLMRRV